MWSNKTKCGIEVTRFIASWVKVGGTLRTGEDYENFEDWLRTLKIDGKNLSEEDVKHITNLATCGKMELEYLAKEFLAKH